MSTAVSAPPRSLFVFKRPAPVSAVQLTAELAQDIADGVAECPEGLVMNEADSTDGTRFYVKTLEGPLAVSESDWVVGPGAEGEYWPVKGSIFDSTYAPWPEEEPTPKNRKPVPFISLPLGAKFTYKGGTVVWVVLQKFGTGLIAEWSEHCREGAEAQQSLCSVANSADELKVLKVLRVD